MIDKPIGKVIADMCIKNLSLFRRLIHVSEDTLNCGFAKVFAYHAFNCYKKKYPILYVLYNASNLRLNITEIIKYIQSSKKLYAYPILALSKCEYSGRKAKLDLYSCSRCPGHIVVNIEGELSVGCNAYYSDPVKMHVIVTFTKKQLDTLKEKYGAKIKIIYK